MNHKEQCVLKNHWTVVCKEYGSLFCGLDIAEYLAVVGMDDVGKRLTGMDTTADID